MKDPTRRDVGRFARKNRLTRRRLGLEVGDRIRIIDIPPDFKDPNYDLKGAEHREMRTAELFRFSLGRQFTVQNFGRYGTVELDAGANREVRKEFGKYQTIWLEPGQLKVVRKKRKTQPRRAETPAPRGRG
jgi:hypothetical protein